MSINILEKTESVVTCTLYDVEFILENDEYVLQGSIEKSNVNSVATMVSLIDAHRQFEQMQKAIKSKGEMSKSLIDKLGRF